MRTNWLASRHLKLVSRMQTDARVHETDAVLPDSPNPSSSQKQAPSKTGCACMQGRGVRSQDVCVRARRQRASRAWMAKAVPALVGKLLHGTSGKVCRPASSQATAYASTSQALCKPPCHSTRCLMTPPQPRIPYSPKEHRSCCFQLQGRNRCWLLAQMSI